MSGLSEEAQRAIRAAVAEIDGINAREVKLLNACVADLQQRLEAAARTVGQVRESEAHALAALERERKERAELSALYGTDLIADRDRMANERDQWKRIAIDTLNALNGMAEVANR